MTNLDTTDSLTDYYCDMEHDLASVSGSDLEQIVEVLLGQFRQLFGFMSEAIYTGGLGSYKISPSERDWYVINFYMPGYSTFILVQSLPRMIIKDEIGEQTVKLSLSRYIKDGRLLSFCIPKQEISSSSAPDTKTQLVSSFRVTDQLKLRLRE
ncbi:hypothetical protein YC2023_068505 [Brassica napus]